ncbi:TonB family protein [Mangrovibacter phragmitis]|uniref:TonB family protein n=1 Tax=Mangrovibacter phragmitis TaxID=1691903 RepID=UPI00336A9D59
MRTIIVFLMVSLFSPVPAMASNSHEHTINYPTRAWHLDQSGTVNVLYDITPQGKAENIRIIKSTNRDLFDDAVKADIHKWRFEKGKPEKDIAVTIHFQK